LKAAYGDESFPKPRQSNRLALDLPVAEMEKLMMQNAKTADDDVRQLASQRAQAVRDALLATGQVGATDFSLSPPSRLAATNKPSSTASPTAST
jgi:hypothetical protein